MQQNAMAMATMASTLPVARHLNAPGLCSARAPLRAGIPSSSCFGSKNLAVRRNRARFLTPVSTADPTSTEQPASEQQQKIEYHFLLANAKFMLDEEEHLQELLRERLRNYDEKKKQQDFWLVIEPKFLDKFPELLARVNRPAVALVSTDKTWITFMKLRIDRVLKGTVEATSLSEIAESNPVSIQFDRPENWTAPYPKYESGWWTPFLPQTNE